ncbi:MAG: DUF4157 domain-containing protein [Anaerolineae bacterium]|nr:DUF4157 domain-containing protein [Anaerolineae bacterium]
MEQSSHPRHQSLQAAPPSAVFTHALDQIGLFPLQAKLVVGEADDPAEDEADRVADEVMRMPDAATQTLQRCACGGAAEPDGECAACKAQRLEVQRKSEASEVGAAPAIVDAVLRSPGQPLDAQTRRFMEPRFGHDFSNVRVHIGDTAARSAQAVRAKAYTVGQDVVFGEGEHAPGSAGGKALLAHELTHTIQQTAATGYPRKMWRFEAPVHEAGERQGLTSEGSGAPSPNGLTNEEASAVYMGNWMRDLNQVFVPLIVGIMPANVAFAAMSYMAAKKFGMAMTPEQFGYYLLQNTLTARLASSDGDDSFQISPTSVLRACPAPTARPNPYVTQAESVEPGDGRIGNSASPNLYTVDQTGTAAWIRRTNMHIERRLELAARQGRNPDGMLHFGAALHAIEDFFAHSNWIEIAINQLMSEDRSLLPALSGEMRQVFTYTDAQTVGTDERGQPMVRQVLMSGSFTGTDTQISLSSEFVKFLSTPLSPPASAEERHVEERFIEMLLNAFENQLRNDRTFADGIRGILSEGGVPEVMIPTILALPLANIYSMTRLPIPDVIRNNILNPIQSLYRDQLSRQILQPMGQRLQAEALNARVADTSLINFERDSEHRRRQTVAQVSEAERQRMRQTQRFTGRTPEQQNAEAQATAGRHADALQATPERIVAGPSHSQIAKDHPNSPFFGLAFRLKSEAVRRLRQHMVSAWAAQAGGMVMPFNFDFGNFPQVSGLPDEQTQAANENRNLYHATRQQRGRQAQESLGRGNRIVSQGGDMPVEQGYPATSFRPYDITSMRHDLAEQFRVTASGLRAAAGAPDTITSALQQMRRFIQLLDAKSERSQQAQAMLDRASQMPHQARNSIDAVAGLTELASRLEGYASRVGTTTTIRERWAVNALLVATRDTAINQLAHTPSVRSGLAASILVMLNDVVAKTTPAYSMEQRAVIEGAHLSGHHGPAGDIPTSVIDLGDARIATDPAWNAGQRPTAVVALIEESRTLINHPSENRWWVGLVTDYVRRNQAQILADIEARNLGFATFWRPGMRRQDH